MRLLLRLALVCSLLTLTTPTGAQITPAALEPRALSKWEQISATLAPSLARMTMLRPAINVFTGDEGMVESACTAFSINAPKNLFMTAAHCLGQDMKLDGHPVAGVFISERDDLMILQCYGINAPSLRPSHKTMRKGTDIAAFGFGYGWTKAMFRHGEVAIPDMLINELHAHFLVTNFTIVGGMSGGPMVDDDGRVVSINQMGNYEVGLGRPLSVILDVTAPYWQFD